MLTIDGSQGEGGGQILRTALSLSMITRTPFRIERVRAGRRKPGLLRQHLTCVEAAARISSADVVGGTLGSTALSFTPRAITGGTFSFAIGTSGSTTLVFQTILPALLTAREPSTVTLSGGTHNPFAPTFNYIAKAYLPLLHRMGADVEIRLERYGFHPAGGGRWQAQIVPPVELCPLALDDWEPPVHKKIIADVANIPFDVAEREAVTAAELLSWPRETAVARSVDADGPGNVLAVEIGGEEVTDIFTGFGSIGISAEAVAESVVREVRSFLMAKVPVGPHLADQLLLPLALAGGGSFVTQAPTEHTRTNIAVIEKFLPVEFSAEELSRDRWRIAVSA